MQEANYAHIRTVWKDFQIRFDAEDKIQQEQASEEELSRRRALFDSHEAFRQSKSTSLATLAKKLAALRPGVVADKLVERSEKVEFIFKDTIEMLEKA